MVHCRKHEKGSLSRQKKVTLMRLLNTDILYEKLVEAGFDVTLHRHGLPAELSGYRFHFPDRQADPGILEICPADDADTILTGPALYLGARNPDDLPDDALWYLCRDADEKRVLNCLEELFCACRETDAAMALARVSPETLNRICSIATDYFQTFCFVHDEQFCLIGYDRRLDLSTITGFEYSEQYGCYMQATSVLNDFRTNPAYQRTLHTEGCQFWTDPDSEECCLYMNLFLYGRYHGRFIVSLRDNTPGRAAAVEYFGKALLETLAAESLAGPRSGDLVTRLLKRYADGESPVPSAIAAAEKLPGWDSPGSFVCGILRLYNDQLNTYMVRSVCTGILERIPGSSLYYAEGRIYILISLRLAQMRTSDIRMGLSELIRESLLKAAVSDEFSALADYPQYMGQAAACLRYMEQNRLTDWFGEFRQIAVPYWLRNGTTELPASLLTARGIRLLQQYDAANDTELCRTLQVYLLHERNATVTSRILRIHRSTLPHRLTKIEEITGLNLDYFPTRMHLLMSFAWMTDHFAHT